MCNYFYGWYFRCQSSSGSIAVIPAVHLSEKERSCSIQIITQKGSWSKEFPISQFRIDRRKGIMQIGENLFSKKGIRLSFEAAATGSFQNGQKSSSGTEIQKIASVQGILRFRKWKKPQYHIMGPFAHIPGMQCQHAVYSMRHLVNGELTIDHEKMCFQNAMGYMEGDSGTSFPDQYIWTQHFLPQGSLMLAAASIPLAGIHFTGCLGFILLGNREYRFAAYLGGSVQKINSRELWVRQGQYRLRARFSENGRNLLKAPENGKMTRQVQETVAGGAEYILTYKNQRLLYEKTGKAAIEYDEKK